MTMFEIIYRHDPSRPSSRQPPANPEEACRRLEEGNQAFATLGTGTAGGTRVVYIDLEDIGMTSLGGAPKQQPFAVVLGCSDARVPTELIFDCACNELFVVRVAGNVLGQEQLGSIDYAVENLGENLKLLVVLGHSKCGAVTAAVDAYLKPDMYLSLLASHHIRAIVNSVSPAVRGAAKVLSARWGEEVVRQPGYRTALIECGVILNAALKAAILREEFGGPGTGMRIVFGVYDLASRRVDVPREILDEVDGNTHLVDACTGPEGFRQFAAQVASSPLMRRLLGRMEGEGS
jgi:carbonic anhydrase